MKKYLLALVAIITLSLTTVSGSLAFISATSQEIKNTFSFGDINIELAETTETYKMIPGNMIAKDPTITVKADSENCYLFVEIEKSENFDSFMTYTVAEGWTKLEDGVYYMVVNSSTADQRFNVLADNEVFVKETVTKTMFNELTEETLPTLTFTAYAIQQSNIKDAATAWSLVH